VLASQEGLISGNSSLTLLSSCLLSRNIKDQIWITKILVFFLKVYGLASDSEGRNWGEGVRE
jgi:hypothetical protein